MSVNPYIVRLRCRWGYDGRPIAASSRSAARIRLVWAWRDWCEYMIAEYDAQGSGWLGWTPERELLNVEITEAGHAVSWLDERLIRRRVLRKLDYLRRTGQI